MKESVQARDGQAVAVATASPPGTNMADRLVGGLLGGFGMRHTTNLMNALPTLPREASVLLSVIAQTAKGVFGLHAKKRKVTKTRCRDP